MCVSIGMGFQQNGVVFMQDMQDYFEESQLPTRLKPRGL